METSLNPLHLNSKLLTTYSPLIGQSNMYATHPSHSTKSTLERILSAVGSVMTERMGVPVKSENFSMKVKYVPECSLEEINTNCIIDNTAFRTRLISEAASVDSEDSFIVFGTGSESDFDDCDCLDEDETSDSESETETESKTQEEMPRNKVRFNLNPTIHNMVKWDFAYRAARRGPWEQMARDRQRFKDRITCTGRVLETVLASNFRTEIWKKRFAPEQ